MRRTGISFLPRTASKRCRQRRLGERGRTVAVSLDRKGDHEKCGKVCRANHLLGLSQMSACYIPFYPGDYLRDTARLTTLEHGAYLLLLMDYYAFGSLPTGDDRLSQIVRMTLNEWLTIKPIVQQFFDKNWRHKRVEHELSKHKHLSANGKLGGRPKKSAFNRLSNGEKPNERPKPSHTNKIQDRDIQVERVAVPKKTPPPPPPLG